MNLTNKSRLQLESMKLRKEKEKVEKLKHKSHHSAMLTEVADLDESDPKELKVKLARTSFHGFIKSKIEKRLLELDSELAEIDREIVKKTK